MSDILCKDCRESDPNEKWGCYKIYCDWYKMYVDPQDTCNHAVRRGYYISTAVCEMLGLEEDHIVQSTIVDFSKNVLQVNSEKMELVKEYDKVGPGIAEAIFLENDKTICEAIYSSYLVPVSNLIRSKQFDNAINLYTKMVTSLQDYYGYLDNGIGSSCVSFGDEPKDKPKVLRRK